MSRHPILARTFAPWLLAGLALVACERDLPPPPLRIVDLVTAGGLTSDRGRLEPTQVACANESQFALTLEPGEEVSALVELGAAPRLAVSGCQRRAAGAPQSADGGRIALRVEPATGAATGGTESGEDSDAGLEAVIELPRFSRWVGGEVDLERFAGRRVRLRLSADIAAERSLFLRDLYLEHRPPEPAPTGDAPSRRREAAVDDARPPVLLISVDTLRADALGALGGPWPTPHLDRLVADAQVWSPHYATAGWTKPSHGSLLTGQMPPVHGATGFESVLRPGVVTLAERFRAGGYATAGLVFDCLWLNPRFGFARGFDDYRSVHWTLAQQGRAAADWMTAHRDEPFFYFFHTFEVHSDFRRLPYEAPGMRPRTIEKQFGVPGYGCRGGVCASGMLRKIDEGVLEPLENEAEILRLLYGAGVRHLDEELGRLFERLREAGLYSRLLIVLTSDHGEAFLEHGELLHGKPWEEVVRVPLIVKWPQGRFAGERRQHLSSSIDVAPTLLAAAGIAADGMTGRDLLAQRSPRPVFSDSKRRLVIAGDLKAAFDPADGPPWLFDLAADPGEQHDLAAARPDEVQAMALILAARRERDRRLAAALDEPVPESSISPEERRRLEALGYVGAP